MRTQLYGRTVSVRVLPEGEQYLVRTARGRIEWVDSPELRESRPLIDRLQQEIDQWLRGVSLS